MAEIHLLQHVAAFVLALWWTKQWLITRPVSRWRFVVAAFAGAILWVFVAFTGTSVWVADGGTTVEFGTIALAWFAAFMAFVSLIGMVVGLLLWTEEEIEDASAELPSQFQVGND